MLQLQQYLTNIKVTLTSSSIVKGFRINKERLIDTTLYLDIDAELKDGSKLSIVEYVVFEENNLKKIKYKYHWQSNKTNRFLRWDNIPHHREIDSFPHHKHISNKVESSSEVDLNYIIQKISTLIK